MKNNNRDYTELQLHYLDLDEYICENIYPINNIVFTEKINWLTGLAAVGGAVALGFLVKFIWKSITNNNIKREQIKKAKEATKKQKEENEKKKSEANLSSEQEEKLDEVNNASAAEIKEKIVPAFEQSEEKDLNKEKLDQKEPLIDSKDSEKEISSKPNDGQQNHENPITSDSNSTKNNIKKIINNIDSLEKKVEQIIEKQAQIVSQDQHKDLEDKKIDQDKIETKPLPVETIKENYDEEFNNFIDLYNENMKIVDFTFKYISYHYDDLKRISIECNKNKKSYEESPLYRILSPILYILRNLDYLINLFLKFNNEFKLSRVKSYFDNKELLNADAIFKIISGKESLVIAIYSIITGLSNYGKLDENPWLKLYIDLFKDENYNKTYCILEKGVYETIIQKHEDQYKDTALINDIDNTDGNLYLERERFSSIKDLLKKVSESEVNLLNAEMINTFIKLRKEQLKEYLLEQAAQQNNQ